MTEQTKARKGFYASWQSVSQKLGGLLAALFGLFLTTALSQTQLSADGRFGYRNFSLYWSDDSRLPFLARLHGKVVGFALVTRNSEPFGDGQVWDMAEFFVLRRYRHRGIGTELATEVWRRCPGRWQIRVMEKNTHARSIWESSIAKFTGAPAHPSKFVVDGVPWYRFSFDSGR